ncbi:unnamed protein product [Hyaloperonospora brassicae]|uniref:RRM domain-containing protein n=1 Tax=Hyaloperonospora brassicae TaxID=162125 RepID=A0AAV0TFH5_HYABA|nr:unnamed protein product [Hyaloperonospora brassicae]
MGDNSVATVWESELLRARQWIAATRLDAQHEQTRLFQRVKAHIGFFDHRRSLQSENMASDDEDDAAALDFLADVDVADMNALLQAEAAGATALLDRDLVNARGPQAPLAMPVHLASPPPQEVVKPMDPVETSRMDASVEALIETLALDVTHVEPFDADAGATGDGRGALFELLQTLGRQETETAVTRDVEVEFAIETEPADVTMRQVVSKSPAALCTEKDETKKTQICTTARSDVKEDTKGANWPANAREHVEPIGRNGNVRRKQRHAKTLEEERCRTRRQEQVTLTLENEDESDCESDGSVSSAYSPSPAEDEGDSELDETNVVDLLGDDEDRWSVKRKRKRLRQTDVAPKTTKVRSRKPVVTHKLTQQHDAGQDGDSGTERRLRAGSETRRTLAAAERSPAEGDLGSMTCVPSKLLSCKDKFEANGKDGSLEGGQHRLMDNASTSGTCCSTAKCGETTESVVRLEVPDDATSLLGQIEENDDNEKEARVSETVSLRPATKSNGATHTDSNALVGSSPVPLAPKSVDHGPHDAPCSLAANDNDATDAADAHVSDTEMVDVKGKCSPVQDEVVAHRTVSVATPDVVFGSDVGEEQGSVALEKVVDGPTWVDNGSTGDAQQRPEASDEDLSEAETEILEDDTPDTNDLGLDDSDGSDFGIDNFVNKPDRVTCAQVDCSGNERDGLTLEGKATDGKHGSTSSNQRAPNGQKESASIDGVHQFFDYVPVKVTRATTTALKPLPVHDHDVTHVQSKGNEIDNLLAKPKNGLAMSSNPSIGSNGLRPSKTPRAMTAIRRGKYLQVRRCTKMLKNLPEGKRKPPRQYTEVPTNDCRVGSNQDSDDVPLAFLTKEMLKTSADESQARYLSYAGRQKKSDELPSNAAKAPRFVSKSRYGGELSSSTTSAAQSPLPTSIKKHPQVVDNSASNGKYKREPQISIYDALHIDGQDAASGAREGSGYKRPSRFKKMQEEAVRKGVCVVKSRVRDADWDKLPIPKKRRQTQKAEELIQVAAPQSLSKSDHVLSKGARHDDRRKKKSAPYSRNSISNHYGPQGSQPATSDKHDLISHGRPGRERDSRNRKKRQPVSSSRDRSCFARDGRRSRDDRQRRGSPRSRSRSLSPRIREDSSNHSRHRSRSRSWERSSKRDYRRLKQTMKTNRDHHREADGRRRSTSVDSRGSWKTESVSKGPLSGKVSQYDDIGGTDTFAKKREIPDVIEAPSSPGVLATFDSDDDGYITDSDDDGRALAKNVEDIRVDLESVSVDEALLMRQVYVSGLNPTVCAAQIEEDFARFGVGVDRETGFPAIEVFACQRNYLGRGDARVTFTTEGGAKAAVEELNSKNVKNSMIRVRQMDVHTQRILMLQFQVARDMWKCTGTQCRANVSVWNAKCDKCGRNRVYGPSNTKIEARSWLCSLCLTANDPTATTCHGCIEALPEVDRSSFYAS